MVERRSAQKGATRVRPSATTPSRAVFAIWVTLAALGSRGPPWRSPPPCGCGGSMPSASSPRFPHGCRGRFRRSPSCRLSHVRSRPGSLGWAMQSGGGRSRARSAGRPARRCWRGSSPTVSTSPATSSCAWGRSKRRTWRSPTGPRSRCRSTSRCTRASCTGSTARSAWDGTRRLGSWARPRRPCSGRSRPDSRVSWG